MFGGGARIWKFLSLWKNFSAGWVLRMRHPFGISEPFNTLLDGSNWNIFSPLFSHPNTFSLSKFRLFKNPTDGSDAPGGCHVVLPSTENFLLLYFSLNIFSFLFFFFVLCFYKNRSVGMMYSHMPRSIAPSHRLLFIRYPTPISGSKQNSHDTYYAWMALSLAE